MHYNIGDVYKLTAEWEHGGADFWQGDLIACEVPDIHKGWVKNAADFPDKIWLARSGDKKNAAWFNLEDVTLVRKAENWQQITDINQIKIGDYVKFNEAWNHQADWRKDAYKITDIEYVRVEHGDPRYSIIHLDTPKGRSTMFYMHKLLFNAGGANYVAPRPSFKKGDKVVVIGASDIEGGPKWLAEMDECVNEKGQVLEVDKNVYLIATNSGEYYYNPESLKSLREFKREGGKLKIKEGNLEAELALAKAAFLKKVKKQASGNANYAVFIDDGEGGVKVSENIGDVCHARLQQNGQVLAVHDFPWHNSKPDNYGYRKEVKDMDAYRKHVDFMLNRSPWAHCYIEKDVDKFMENGTELDVNVSINQIAGACITMRHGTEHPEKSEAFKWFLENGIEEKAAWLAGNFVVIGEDGTVKKSDADGGHCGISSGIDADDLLKFMKQGYHRDQEKRPMKEFSNRYSVFASIGKSHYDDAERTPFSYFVKKHIQGKEIGTGWNKRYECTKEGALNLAKAIELELNK